MSKISDFCKDRAAFYKGVAGQQSADDELLMRCKEMLAIDIKEIAELKGKLSKAKKGLREIRDYGNDTESGYPEEIAYDEFAYNRIVDSYREAARKILQSLEE